MVPKFQWALAGLLLLHGSISFAAEPKKVALLVGVNKYQRRGFPDLNYAERDVEQLALELKKFGFQTTLLKGSDAGAAQATRANIEAALQKLVANTGKEDIVLVSLCGHGAQFEVKQADNSLREDAFFCPLDATLGEPKTLLSLSYVIDEVLAKKGGKNLLLIDACRDNPKAAPPREEALVGPAISPNFSLLKRGIQGKVVALPESTAVLFACSAGEESVESSRFGGGHGAFTYCVLEALKGKAVRDGEVSWTGLVDSVETLMESDPVMRKLLDNASPQRPIHSGNVPRVVLGKVVKLPAGVASSANPVQPTPPAPPASSTPLPDSALAVLKRIKHPASASIEAFTNTLGMKLVSIPAGEFEMGSPESDKDANDDEKPQRRVQIREGFLLGMYEVTQLEWKTLLETEPWKSNGVGPPAYVRNGDNYPATNINWDDAADFCKKLSEKEGVTYRLPTEAEWEYACRAGTTTIFSFGDEAAQLDDYAWWGGLVGGGNASTDRHAYEVGLKKPNAFGLYDMHGNVWEWCEQSRDDKENRSDAPRPMRGPPLPTKSGRYSHIVRGGAWYAPPADLRAANRGRISPDWRYTYKGLRVLLDTRPMQK